MSAESSPWRPAESCRRLPSLSLSSPHSPSPLCRPMPAGANPYFQLTEEEAIELTKAEAEENP